MYQWERPPVTRHYSLATIQRCVRQEDWQAFREGLKGLPTSDKLDELSNWLSINRYTDELGIWTAHVQVSNYLNALKRGGLLNSDLKVVR